MISNFFLTESFLNVRLPPRNHNTPSYYFTIPILLCSYAIHVTTRLLLFSNTTPGFFFPLRTYIYTFYLTMNGPTRSLFVSYAPQGSSSLFSRSSFLDVHYILVSYRNHEPFVVPQVT